MVEPSRFSWNATFEIGDSFIDDQHRHIFRLAEIMETALCHGLGCEVAEEAVGALRFYILHHFNEEEAYFRHIGSPLMVPM